MIAKEKLFLLCNVESFVKSGVSWPLTSPTTILWRISELESKEKTRARFSVSDEQHRYETENSVPDFVK
jgi:hypothetical protein